MHIFMLSGSKSVRNGISFSDSRHFWFSRFFQPSIWPEVDDEESWDTIPYRVMSPGTQMSNFKNIGSKLWPWQCTLFTDQYGGHDVINYVNEPKHERAQLDLYGTISAKFYWNQSSSLSVLARTDRHTDRHTLLVLTFFNRHFDRKLMTQKAELQYRT